MRKTRIILFRSVNSLTAREEDGLLLSNLTKQGFYMVNKDGGVEIKIIYKVPYKDTTIIFVNVI